MSQEHQTGDLGGITLQVGLDGYKTIDYNKRVMRKTLTKGGGELRKEARRLLSRRAVSAPGDIPGEQTGRLKRSIGIISRGSRGGWIKVGPRAIPGSMFYPAILYYGSKKTGVSPRANFMAMALQNRKANIRNTVRAALRGALVPR